jgi:2-polyprenyl-6-methoxyphenol hydroxylase-like FAD-dependent oxidoreductase
MSTQTFDVIVVGASLGGCSSAILLAREGLRVALVERHRDPEAHKRLCTHFIQPSATPVLRRLGLDRLIEAAGGVRNSIEIHTPSGWIGDHLGCDADGQPLHGYNIRRATLDPLLRRLAAETPGVTLMAGRSVSALIETGGRVTGVRLRGDGDAAQAGPELQAQLVVAADGRQSELAALAGVRARSAPTSRFGVAVAVRGADLRRGTTSQMWLTGPEAAYIFPNDDGVSVLTWMAPREAFDACHARPLQALLERLRGLPDAPRLQQIEPLAEPMMVKDFPSLWRPAVVRGMALVGDAQQSIDYLWGIGCGWALQSAGLLADAVAPALLAQQPLAAALTDYQKCCRRAFAGHRFLINDFARRQGFNPIERLMFAAAAKDVTMARHVNRFGARIDPPARFLAPTALLRALWVNLRQPLAAAQGTRRDAAMPTASANRPIATLH